MTKRTQPMTRATDDEFLTVEEVAKLRRKTRGALDTERWRGDGPPFIRDGKRILYPRRGLDEWLASRPAGGRSESAA